MSAVFVASLFCCLYKFSYEASDDLPVKMVLMQWWAIGEHSRFLTKAELVVLKIKFRVIQRYLDHYNYFSGSWSSFSGSCLQYSTLGILFFVLIYSVFSPCVLPITHGCHYCTFYPTITHVRKSCPLIIQNREHNHGGNYDHYLAGT